ncbi:MAG: hypothetical protein ABIJ75_06200, partial [Actinomycetota bacterium]
MHRGYPGVDHVGPMAQELASAFGPGAGTTSIATRAIAGVALLSILALAAENAELEAKVDGGWPLRGNDEHAVGGDIGQSGDRAVRPLHDQFVD